VALSVASLAAALAGGVTSAAPAGLAASVSSSALAGCVAAAGVAIGTLKLLTMTKLKLGAISALLIGGLGTSLIVQHQSLARLQEERGALQRQLEELRAARRTALAAANKEEPDTRRRAESELVRLRGEVTSLRRELQSAAAASTNSAQTEQASNPDSAWKNKLHASIRTEVPNGQTLLTGGWATGKGSRVFVLATPRVWVPTEPTAQGGPADDQVTIKTQVIEVPDRVLARVGLDALAVDGNESSSYNVMTKDQVERLILELAADGKAKILSGSSVMTVSGRQAEVQTIDEHDPGGTNSLNHTIDLLPVVSSDKSAVELTLDAGLTKPGGKN
ncbi:MAG: hypothetical protein ACREIC_33020, partial [Limisphaerales bacterium]